MTYTVIGGGGHIGSAVCTALEADRLPFQRVTRHSPIPSNPLGHIIFAAGVTGDFLSRRKDTLHAHVEILASILSRDDYDSLTYLSSTRVYKRSETTSEDQSILVLPEFPDDFYAITKIMGESLCLGVTDRPVKVLRLSNVVGNQAVAGNFLHDVITQARMTGHVTFTSSFSSSKDYIALSDVVEAILMISRYGNERIYNVASGLNVTHGEIARLLMSELDAKIHVAPDAPTESNLPISTIRIASEFGLKPRSVTPIIQSQMHSTKERIK